MNDFALYVVQEQEGCDHTIGCGRTLIHLNASTVEGALVEAKDVVLSENRGFRHEDGRLHSALLVSRVSPLPVETWYAEHAATQKQRGHDAKEANEKAELARLLAKHGAP